MAKVTQQVIGRWVCLPAKPVIRVAAATQGSSPLRLRVISSNSSHQLIGAECGADGCQLAPRRQGQWLLLPGPGPPSWAVVSVESPFVKQPPWAGQGSAGMWASVPPHPHQHRLAGATSSSTSLAGQAAAGCHSWQNFL